jgi:hypothetical protein
MFLALLAAGCGPSFGDVSGTVEFQGRPLTTGTITFYDEANGVASSPIQPDGTYAVHHVRAGPAKIAVAVPTAITMVDPGEMPALGPPAPVRPTGPFLPHKYQDPQESGLTCEVKAGPQEFAVRLE